MKKSSAVATVPTILLVLFLSLAAPASAQTTTDTLHACYVPSSGTVYRIKSISAPTGCVDATHVQFSFNAKGPAGDVGPTGATGPKGEAGSVGPAGAAGQQG